MPIIDSTAARTFELADAVFTGLAAPSRGSSENSVWRVRLRSTEPGAAHTLDREEVLVALSGRAVATLDGTEHDVAAGDAIVVPAGTVFALRCAESHDSGEPGFEAVAVLPVGGQARMLDGESFTPPWAE
jgi:mannose-6-phosphate isomerase-like protein (cupin superfamily)